MIFCGYIIFFKKSILIFIVYYKNLIYFFISKNIYFKWSISITKKLILWRHAQAEIGIDDFNRSLNNEGKNEAKMMAEIILKNKSPNLILCSTAIRAKETLGHLIRLNIESPTLYDESLYLAEPKKITDCIIKNASDEETILLVAHNPGIHELTLNLSQNSSHSDLEEGYPTASISIIELGNDDWHDLGNKKLELIKFIRPRDLNN